jgi:hypothetical protein
MTRRWQFGSAIAEGVMTLFMGIAALLSFWGLRRKRRDSDAAA